MARKIKNISEEQEEQAGEALAELLHLKKHRYTKRYKTTWGDKTATGLYRTIVSMIVDQRWKDE